MITVMFPQRFYVFTLSFHLRILEISSCATTEVRDDLLQANAKGKSACREFVLQRCSSTATGDFFDPLKKLKLKSFKDLKAVTKVRAKFLRGWRYWGSLAR